MKLKKKTLNLKLKKKLKNFRDRSEKGLGTVKYQNLLRYVNQYKSYN